MSDDRMRVGVDIGGTFTDLALYEPGSGRLWKEKVLTTPDDPSEGVLTGIDLLLSRAGVAPANVGMVIHGTTLVANALIERKGASIALITTRGFRDVLEIGREMRYDTYDLAIEMPPPLVERDLRFEVAERLGPDGCVIEPLSLDSLGEALRIMRDRGIQAVGICLLHSYRNPAHEQAVRDHVRRYLPEAAIAISSEVIAELGEYERTNTTLCNAYVQPLFDRYVGDLEHGIRERGLSGRLYLMLSDGGTMHPEAAQRFPIRLVQSGPAGGVQAAALIGRLLGEDRVLCFDMGGTTAKACLVEDSRPVRTTEFEVARVWRFKKGSGLPLKVPVVNMIEIGAGGGSIAGLDSLGFTQVGPESASSKPGPACYGLGGNRPTVTDADLVLGYLAPDRFLGGDMPLDLEAAERAIMRHVGEPAGLGLAEAAWSIFETVTENMAQAAMIHALEMGKRLSDYTMIAIGGAGPVHALSIARRLGIRRVICPSGAGVASAFGFLTAPISFEFVQSDVCRLSELRFPNVLAALSSLRGQGEALLREAGVGAAETMVECRCAARYAGQGYQVEFEVPLAILEAGRSEELRARFEAAYRASYGRTETSGDIETVTWLLKVRGPDPAFRLPLAEVAGSAEEACTGRRQVYFRETSGSVEVPVYDRYRLGPGSRCMGPAIIEERESTLVLPPGWGLRVDRYNNLIAEPEPQG
ncbi:MAG: hydantoinase/oxoprolinase family protein [Alphaproteobacteria bacterium]|nr:hydantoinase/oxoprolinase family protein [Alphaproteobacteria bacterium]